MDAAAPRPGLFANPTVVRHLVRGACGFGFIVMAVRGFGVVGWPALLLFGPAFLMLKGCPVCWSIGLVQTVAGKLAGARAHLRPPGG